MSKIFVEDTEIEIIEKSTVEDGEQKVSTSNYTMKTIVTTEFKSTIFSYPNGLAVLISREVRFNQPYYKIVLFSDKEATAWQFELISSKLNIQIKRLEDDKFLVVGESREQGISSQVSFYKLLSSGRIDNVTMNFTKLRELRFIHDDCVMICFDDVNQETAEVVQTLCIYNYDGKLTKKFYEFSSKDEIKYTYKIEKDILKVIRKKQSVI